jgi:hypothetical protein
MPCLSQVSWMSLEAREAFSAWARSQPVTYREKML